MKNYPLLTVNKNYRYFNWRNNYIKPLLQQVEDLSYYSYFIIPPYRQIEYTSAGSVPEGYTQINDNFIISGASGPDTLLFPEMPTHAFFQVVNETQVKKDSDSEPKVTLSAGTWIASNARDEGKQNFVNNFEYYSYIPGGYGSFYSITDIKWIDEDNYKIIFTYLRNAGEVFGYAPYSNLIFNNNRFTLKNSRIHLLYYGQTVNSTYLGTYIDVNEGEKVFTSWYTLGTPMHFFFTTDGTNDYGEEVILDETNTINLEYANTHSYTIDSKHDATLFYIDFI